jgi:hypothetical protein
MQRTMIQIIIFREKEEILIWYSVLRSEIKVSAEFTVMNLRVDRKHPQIRRTIRVAYAWNISGYLGEN